MNDGIYVMLAHRALVDGLSGSPDQEDELWWSSCSRVSCRSRNTLVNGTGQLLVSRTLRLLSQGEVGPVPCEHVQDNPAVGRDSKLHRTCAC